VLNTDHHLDSEQKKKMPENPGGTQTEPEER
jgi:hypothetical protein